MPTNPTLKNEQLAAYLATNDSVRALEKAVDNGQTRLALQVVLDLISELTERIMDLEDIVNPAEDESDEQVDVQLNIADAAPVLQEETAVPSPKEEVKENAETLVQKVDNTKSKSEETKVSK